MDGFEKEIFGDYKVVESALVSYGFKAKGNGRYAFLANLSEESFVAEIRIDANGEVEGTVYEEGEVYSTYRIPGAKGFASRIKEEYLALLLSVREACFRLAREPDYYLVPSNPSIYDVGRGFADNGGVLDWPARVGLKVGDVVFIYSSKPFGGLRYRCEVVDTPPKEEYGGKSYFINRIRLLETYQKERYPLSWLLENGVKTVRFTHKLKEGVGQHILKKPA